MSKTRPEMHKTDNVTSDEEQLARHLQDTTSYQTTDVDEDAAVDDHAVPISVRLVQQALTRTNSNLAQRDLENKDQDSIKNKGKTGSTSSSEASSDTVKNNAPSSKITINRKPSRAKTKGRSASYQVAVGEEMAAQVPPTKSLDESLVGQMRLSYDPVYSDQEDQKDTHHHSKN